MAISASEQQHLTCVSCGRPFEAEVWTLVDGSERPDLAQALADGALDTAPCPHCGVVNRVNAALLFHDPARRRVYFAVPANTDEHHWREQAQRLLYALMEGLPEEARLPYLGDVQVEHEVAGVRRAVQRRQRGRGARGALNVGKQIPLPEPTAEPDPPPQAAKPLPASGDLADAVQILVSADTLEEFRDVVQRHPALLTQDADDLLRQMAETAYGQGERDMAGALREARATLAKLRAGGTGLEQTTAEPPLKHAVAPVAQPATRLSDAAYQALMRSASSEELIEATRAHPGLLEPWADDELAAREESTLDEGNERLANLIGERRDALAGLRLDLSEDASVGQALQALLNARGEDGLARALTGYPILLTEIAQQALTKRADEARQRGDQQDAELALERRTMLQQVRAGLEA